MTNEARFWYETYKKLTQYQTRRVDNAYTALRQELLKDSNVSPKNGDEAEEMVAYITRYYIQSGGGI